MPTIDEILQTLTSTDPVDDDAMTEARQLLESYTASLTTASSRQSDVLTYKAPEPQLFGGGRNALATRDWLERMERYCKRSNVASDNSTEAAVDYLQGAALTWFRMLSRTKHTYLH
ncbi:hypothetical protein BGX28_000551, partial [Mortierella sp. GBA30]